jgi:hypothetical protein
VVQTQFVQPVQIQPGEDQERDCSKRTDDSVPNTGRSQELPATEQQKPEDDFTRSAPSDMIGTFAGDTHLRG